MQALIRKLTPAINKSKLTNNTLFNINDTDFILYTSDILDEDKTKFIDKAGRFYQFNKNDAVYKVIKSTTDADTYHNSVSGRDISVDEYDQLAKIDSSLSRVYTRNKITTITHEMLNFDDGTYTVVDLPISDDPYIFPAETGFVYIDPFLYIKTLIGKYPFKTQLLSLDVDDKDEFIVVRTFANTGECYNAFYVKLTQFYKNGDRFLVKNSRVDSKLADLKNAMIDTFIMADRIATGHTSFSYDDIVAFFSDYYVQDTSLDAEAFNSFAAQYIDINRYQGIF